MLTTSYIEPISVTATQAAELLGFKDTKSIYRLVREGELRARKSGRIYLISYKSLKNYVEGR
ncbi:helix-turn-helix domain-containing protein [Bifidobacterium simiarum]|uniref:helix-turn-helix domain-containing protein n=1 Tax=Bifidobacterium simiarum TaxID=2045441 RepID=UPI001BDDC643|nr:helix-turn-helix domain-containing protein [Bifidobacterium simiarum]MBT1166463.1 helix-turn-helix domain-containing protein [Bifidobacterium simiarum]